MVKSTNEHNNYSEYVKTFKLEYLFERKQEIKFEVYQVIQGSQLKLLASCETTLAKIMNSRGQTLTNDLKNAERVGFYYGSLIVKGDLLKQCNDEISFNAAAEINSTQGWWCCTADNPYILISRARRVGIATKEFLKVYETNHRADDIRP